LALALGIIALMSGCNKGQDVLELSDSEMIRRYIAETVEGRGLFRTDSLVTTDSYTVSTDPGATYSDSVLSVNRSIDVDVYGDLDWIEITSPIHLKGQPAEAKVTDEIKMLSRKSQGGTDSTFEYSFWLERSGLFVKVGSDLQSYAGWRLYGCNLDQPFVPGNVEMIVAGGASYPADGSVHEPVRLNSLFWRTYIDTTLISIDTITVLDTAVIANVYYQWLLDMPILAEGDSLTFEATYFPDRSVSMLLSAETESGFQQYQMNHPSSSDYDFKISTPASNSRIWNIIFLREIRGDWIRPSDLGQRGWCVAYRLPQ